MTPEEFHAELLQNALARASSLGEFAESAFTEHVAEELVEAGELDGFEYCHYRHEQLGLRVDGYSLTEEQSTLSLVVTEFKQNPSLETLGKREADDAFRRLRRFFERSRSETFFERIEPTSPGYGLAHTIRERRHAYSRVRLYLLTDARLSDRADTPPDAIIDTVPCSHHVWDVSRLHRLAESQAGREDITIDFSDTLGLPCLPAHFMDAPYHSYLIVVPGAILADLYETHGDRLLEQNVRTFLQARGTVNKGIRSTLLSEPDRFFAYNNGVTATAEEVVTASGQYGMRIMRIRNLQIVNGGQTTASLFHARLKDKSSLERVFVQMKLSVIDEHDRILEIIPKISEYANSQNRINAADFFANSPFHLRVEDLSRRLWAPSAAGGSVESHWFYERARGQYTNAQAILSFAERKRFALLNPKSQVITKTDLAKFENSWAGLPHIVSLGAQKNFVEFAKRIGSEWEKRPLDFNERWFRAMVGRAILFRETERIVSMQSWYAGGYRANIVTYSIAWLSAALQRQKQTLDFERIWRSQSLSPAVRDQIAEVAAEMNAVITSPAQGIANVTEWSKKTLCWERASSVQIPLGGEFAKALVDVSDLRDDERDARYQQALTDTITAEVRVVQLGATYWNKLLEWNKDTNLLSEKEIGVVGAATKIPRRVPTEKQCQVIMKALERARAEGFDPTN